MTQRTASFLIRVESGDDGSRGTLTSVQTGEHAAFSDLADLARILERWVGAGSLNGTVEEKP